MRSIRTRKGERILIDNDDYAWASQQGWCRSGRYIQSTTRQRGYLHRLIMERQGADLAGITVDHINNNPLDNRKKNLRVATQSQNQWNKGRNSTNRSGFKGVSFHKPHKKWQAAIKCGHEWIYIGRFDSKKIAAMAYDATAKFLHGEFARTNFQ